MLLLTEEMRFKEKAKKPFENEISALVTPMDEESSVAEIVQPTRIIPPEPLQLDTS